jgi:hypothetical protein
LRLVGVDQRFGLIKALAALGFTAQRLIGISGTTAAALACGIDDIPITKSVADTDEQARRPSAKLLLRSVIADSRGYCK